MSAVSLPALSSCPLGCTAPVVRVASYPASRALDPLLREQASGRDIAIFRCGRCRLEWLGLPSLPARDPAEEHFALAIHYADTAAEERRAAHFLAVIERHRPQTGRLFDVGCGLGFLLRQAQGRGWQVAGNELIAPLAEQLRANEDLAVAAGRLPALDLPPASFDVVTAYCVLPHMSEPVAELRAAAHLLRPGGLFIAELPADGLFRRAARWLAAAGSDWGLRHVYHGGHRLAFGPESIRRLCALAGLEVVAVEPYRVPPAASTRRFALEGEWRGRLSGWAVRLAQTCSGGRLANHMLMVAAKPATPVPVASPTPAAPTPAAPTPAAPTTAAPTTAAEQRVAVAV